MSLYTFDDRVQELIAEIAEKYDINTADAAKIIVEFEKNVKEFMKKEETIRIPNLGTMWPSPYRKAKLKKKSTKWHKHS